MSSIPPKPTPVQIGQPSQKKMMPPPNSITSSSATTTTHTPVGNKAGSLITAAKPTNSVPQIPKVRLKVGTNNAGPPTSQFFTEVGPSGPRPRPPVKYHYPIILDDDEEEDEDDGGDADYAEDDGTFSSHRKRKDSVQPSVEIARKNGNESKHKKAVNKKPDAGKDRKGKTAVREANEVSKTNGTHVKGDADREKRTADVLKSKKKDQKLASIERNSARREKLNSGLGNSHTVAKASGFDDDSDELSSLPDEYKSEDEAAKIDRKIKREKRRRRHGSKRCSCSSHAHRHRHRDRHVDLPLESAFAGSLEEDMQFPSGQPQALDNEPQLPEGIDPTNVEDVFLDVAQPNHAWSTDEEEEEILFAALDDFEDTAQTDDGGVADTDATEDESSATFSSDSEDDDFFNNDEFGFGSASNLPLVLMEDWSGNLVFAQPVMEPEEKPRPSRATSKSRSKGSRRSGKGSKASSGSTINGEGPALLVDAEAFETEGDIYDDGMSDGGDTTDSLPEEDMPSPPDIIPFSLAAAGLEANNAAFGVTTVDEAALARDLGLPLADARHLLERARAEEQQHILGGVSGLSMDNDIVMSEPLAGLPMPLDSMQNPFVFADTGSQEQSRTSSTSLTTPPVHDALSPDGIGAISPAASANGPIGIPLMGSFTRDAADPERVAVIDGTGKAAPSPFVRRGLARGRSRGTDRGSIKKRTFGQSPAASPVGRPRYSSVPASSRFGSMRGSPMHPNMRHEPFEREDTPSDVEIMIEPISIDDVLDVDALHHYTHDIDHQAISESHEPPRHLRNLQRWERVPITTFRRSRHTGDATIPSPSHQAAAGPFRGSFSSPSMASTLAGASTGPLGYPHGMIVSPILEAVHEQSYNHEIQPRRRKTRKTASNGILARNRTSSLGSMPPLNLGR